MNSDLQIKVIYFLPFQQQISQIHKITFNKNQTVTFVFLFWKNKLKNRFLKTSTSVICRFSDFDSCEVKSVLLLQPKITNYNI